MKSSPWRRLYQPINTDNDFRPPPSPKPDRKYLVYLTILLILIFWYITSIMHPQSTSGGYGKTLTVSNYTVVQGLFVHSDPDFKDWGYELLDDSFGLIDKSPERWIEFKRHIEDLNKNADSETTYKVLYLARHGQGVHNQAEEKYGTPMWNCKWSLLETDGELVWGPDPLLTAEGVEQVRRTRKAWNKQIEDRIPLPEILYSSPLRRAIDTVELTWNDSALPSTTPRKIRENMREMIGLHTCDKRSTRSLLERQYPGYSLDPDFTEADQLWTPDYQEQPDQITLRARLALNNLFATDSRTYISITAHGGFIAGVLRAIGHRHVAIQTAGMIPIVIRATSDKSHGMDPIQGGQSGTAPVCTSSSTLSEKQMAKETRGVEQKGDLVVQSPQ